jgi:hypothetical protein
MKQALLAKAIKIPIQKAIFYPSPNREDKVQMAGKVRIEVVYRKSTRLKPLQLVEVQLIFYSLLSQSKACKLMPVKCLNSFHPAEIQILKIKTKICQW